MESLITMCHLLANQGRWVCVLSLAVSGVIQKKIWKCRKILSGSSPCCGGLKRRDYFTKKYQAGKYFTPSELSANTPRRKIPWYFFWLMLHSLWGVVFFGFFFPPSETLRENRVANMQMFRDVFRVRRLEEVCSSLGCLREYGAPPELTADVQAELSQN